MLTYMYGPNDKNQVNDFLTILTYIGRASVNAWVIARDLYLIRFG